MSTKNYYESHVTIEPVGVIAEVDSKCSAYGFRMAKLFMEKDKPNELDAFMTTRSFEFGDIQIRTVGLVKSLQSVGIVVKRYKIELTLIDSKLKDELELLCTSSSSSATTDTPPPSSTPSSPVKQQQ